MVVTVAGFDGCPAGWIGLLVSGENQVQHRLVLCERFADILNLQPQPEVIAIDIPIGLLNERVAGGRECDREARRLLGKPRSNSVFSAPPRAALSARSYKEARPHGLTLQAFGIVRKIREVDAMMTPALQERIYESHPELAFLSLAGHRMRHGKKSNHGREERLSALEAAGAEHSVWAKTRQLIEEGSRQYFRKQVAVDDIVDAYAMAWVAAQVAIGKARRVGNLSLRDARGLRMEILY